MSTVEGKPGAVRTQSGQAVSLLGGEHLGMGA